jgi:protein-tyrosine-phosphatase
MKTVLFVCVGNSGRSQMAEGFFNYFAPPGWRALSAGTLPASRVSQKAVEVMKDENIDISKNTPKSIQTDVIEGAERIISMGCGVDLCPYNLFEGVEDWGIEDPMEKSIEKVREIRDEIKNKVENLIEGLSPQKK